MEKGIIYKWKCLVNDKEYIGQTNIEEKRKNQFIDFEKRYAGNAINNARKKYNNINQWQYSVIDTVECENAELLKSKLDELEIYYIAECNTKVPYGYNITDGGGGIVINGSIGYWNGKSRDEDTKRKIGNANRGTKHSRESIERAVRRRKENPNYDDLCKKAAERLKKIQKKAAESCRIKVYQYNKKGELVNVYKSITEASKEMNCDFTVISECLKGRYNTNHRDFKGYIWSSKKLDKEYIKNYNNFGRSWKKGDVYIYDNKLNLLGKFKTKIEAASYLGASKNYVGELLNTSGKYAVYKGKLIISYGELNETDVEKIYQYSIDGNLIETYYDIKFVPVGYDKECVKKCISSEYGKKSNIYKWCKWTNGNDDTVKYNIVKKDKNGEIIEKFIGVKDIIAKYPDFCMTSIYRCLKMKNGKKKNFYKNFYWESVIK